MNWPGVLPGWAKQHEAGFSREREARFFVGQSVRLACQQ
jgi:hypothetical protein